MGNCRSCEATAVVAPTATAKLVMQDGRLMEFARPARAAQVLQKVENPAFFFVCNSDVMEFDNFVSPVAADEELQPGQLYFLLPSSMLRRPLHADEMAALAVKASKALMSSTSTAACHCDDGAMAPVLFPSAAARQNAVADGTVCGSRSEMTVEVEMRRRRRRRPDRKRGGSKGRDFSTDLNAIPE